MSMTQTTLINQYNNPLEKELLNLFHQSNLPLHFNKTGYKDFNNYQRISLIVLFRRSKKGLRDFVKELQESRWISWLGLTRIPSKSTLHNWITLFQMKTIRQLFNQLKPKYSKLTAIDGTGFDSFHRSRYYEKRVGFIKTPYSKVDLFVDVESKKIIDFSLVTKHQHDMIAAKQFIKRNSLRKYPKGWFRRQCVELPNFMGQRSIIECINAVLKRRFITCLKSKKSYMKKREFGWHMIVYNLTKKIESQENNLMIEQKVLQYFFISIWIY